jgi:hypothetical protein
MNPIKMNRTVATALFAIVLGGASVAAAESGPAPAAHRCEGKGEGARSPEERAHRMQERFQKADKNGDGFLTADEVGERRWAHLVVADGNGDGKITQAELAKAHADGKLGHRGKGPAGKSS